MRRFHHSNNYETDIWLHTSSPEIQIVRRASSLLLPVRCRRRAPLRRTECRLRITPGDPSSDSDQAVIKQLNVYVYLSGLFTPLEREMKALVTDWSLNHFVGYTFTENDPYRIGVDLRQYSCFVWSNPRNNKLCKFGFNPLRESRENSESHQFAPSMRRKCP